MKINSIVNGNILSKEVIIKTGTVVRKGLLHPADCGTLGIDKVCNMRVIDYGENTMMKNLGIDQVLIAKPCGEKDNKKSLIILFKDGEDIYQKLLLSNFDGLKNFVKNLRNEFEAKNIDNMKLRVPAEPIIKFEKNEAGKLTREMEYRVDGLELKLSSIKKYEPETGTLQSITFFQKNDDKKMATLIKYDSKTGNISEKIAYAEDGMSVSNISTFDPKTGMLLKEQTLDKFGRPSYTVEYLPDGKLIKSEEGEFLYDEQGRLISEVDRHGVNTTYTKEGRIKSKVWRDGVWHIYEDYDVHTGHLLKREEYWHTIKIVKEFNPEAPGHLLKVTQKGGAGPWDTEEFYRTEPPYTKYKEIRKAACYEETVYYDSYGNETGRSDNKTRGYDPDKPYNTMHPGLPF